MGTSTDAHCSVCGYDTFLMLGGGMSNHTTYAAWPVSCKTCAAVTTANFKESPLVCQRCKSRDVIPPTDLQFWKGDGNVTESWGGKWWKGDGGMDDALTLTNGHYRCPKCGKFELRFGTNAAGHAMRMWD